MFKLAVSNLVDFPVEVDINSDGAQKRFRFRVLAERISQDELTAEIRERPNESVVVPLTKYIKGWKDQRLVLTDDDQPAPFSDEALAAMLGVVGMPMAIWQGYLQAVGAKGKEKN